jgi:Uma2 family endonuclease
MSTTVTPSQRPEIEYPDCDGQPMSDNTLQFKWIVTIKEGLEALFRNNPDVFVAGDLLWYAEEGKPKIRKAPDAMVVFGRPKGYRGSYKQWLEGSIAPQVVFEVLSPGNRQSEIIRKFRFYERYGVEEYYVYDPDNGDLAGWLRGDSGLEDVAEMNGYISPRLGVRFEPGEGPDRLRIIAPNGRPFLTYVELVEEREAERLRAQAADQRAEIERQRAETERQRAETERQRAETEHLRAETERQRAERLAVRLRELGEQFE